MLNVSKLTIYRTQKYDTGVYVCQATNDLGSDNSYYELNGNILLEPYKNLFEGKKIRNKIVYCLLERQMSCHCKGKKLHIKREREEKDK